MSKVKSICLLIVVSVLILAMTGTSCAAEKGPGEGAGEGEVGKPSKINLVHIGDYSGPYSASVGPLRYGMADSVDYLNKQGGIYGVPVEVICCDTEGKAENTVPAYRKGLAMSPKPIYIFGLDSAGGAILHDRMIEDGVLGSSTADTSVYPYGNTFGVWPVYCDQAGFVLRWAKEKWDSEGNKTKPRIAIFGWDMAYGHAYWTDSVKAYADELGFEVVGEYWYPTSQLDITPLAAKARDANPDFTFCGATSVGTVVWAKAIRAVGLEDKINIGGNGFEFGTYKLAKPEFEGFYSVFNYATYPEIENPGIKVIREYAEQRAEKDTSGFTVLCWPALANLKHMVEATVDRVGWEKALTATELKKTWLSMPEYPLELNGGILGYGGGMSETRYSPNKLRMYQAREQGPGGAGFYPVSDWRSAPDLAPDSLKEGR